MKSPAFQMPFRHVKTTQKALRKLFSPPQIKVYQSVEIKMSSRRHNFWWNTGRFLREKLAGFFLNSLCLYLRVLWRGALWLAMPGAGQAGSHLCSLPYLCLTEHTEKHLCQVYPQLKMCSRQRLSCSYFCPNFFIKVTLAANVIRAEYSQKPTDEDNLFIFF